MKSFRLPSLLLTACLALASARATTVIPPTFDDLVAQAELIFQGTVTNVQSQWVGEGGQRHIVSYITVQVEDTIKGNPGETYTIQMLGGTVGDQTMEVSDSPKFKVGDRDILFVEHNGTQFIPLVGIMHGRFRVEREAKTGAEVVKSDKGRPVKDLSALGKDERAAAPQKNSAASSEDSLRAADFKAAIRAKLGAKNS